MVQSTPSLILTKRHLSLAKLLRYYRVNKITCPEEIDIRSRVDKLLGCYGVMEIAILVGFIHPPDESFFWKEARAILEDPQISEYYTLHFPMKLPQLLLRRLQGASVSTTNGHRCFPHFVKFLRIDSQFVEKLFQSRLLRMFDSSSSDHRSLEEAIRLIGDQFIARMLLHPDERDFRDIIISELATFLDFSFKLQDLLHELGEERLVQSEVWSHYGHWFGTTGWTIEHYFHILLNQFVTCWDPKLKNHGMLDLKSRIAAVKALISDLTSSVYAEPLNKALMRANVGA
jgi:hypothetical protein